MKSKNYNRNVETIKALKRVGSDFTIEHLIEHHLYCYSLEDYERLIALGEGAGYKVMYEGLVEDDDGDYWQLDLVKKVTPTLENIERQSVEIESFEAESNADYDGWGTEVETKL